MIPRLGFQGDEFRLLQQGLQQRKHKRVVFRVLQQGLLPWQSHPRFTALASGVCGRGYYYHGIITDISPKRLQPSKAGATVHI